MDMLGHHHVPDEQELEAQPNGVHDFHKSIARSHRPEIRPAPIATKRNEVQIISSVESPQSVAFVFHRCRTSTSKPAPLQPKGCGTHHGAPVSSQESWPNDILRLVPTKECRQSMRHPPVALTSRLELEHK